MGSRLSRPPSVPVSVLMSIITTTTIMSKVRCLLRINHCGLFVYFRYVNSVLCIEFAIYVPSMNKQQKLRKQYKSITISIHKMTGEKHKKRATNGPHRFPKFAVKTPWMLLVATNHMNLVSFSLERKMSLKISELWLSKHTSIEL